MEADIEKRISEFSDIIARKAELENELADVKSEIKEKEPGILRLFGKLGIQNININGRTVYLHRRYSAGPAEGCTKDDVVAALKKNKKLKDIVSLGYHWKTLSSLCQEYADKDQPLPVAIRDVVEAKEIFSVRSRKSPK
jgi:hypothetical protein